MNQTALQTAGQQINNAPRYDIYALSHKALRAAMAAALSAAGRMDTDDNDETRATLGEVRELLALCHDHLDKENEFIHPAMETRAPGAATQAMHDHEEHRESLVELERLNDAIEHADAGIARARAGTRLYHALALFVAENFAHMRHEETAHNAVLCAHYTDDELKALHHRLVASVAPEMQAQLMRHLLPAVTRRERAIVLGGMKREMPAPVFSAALSRFRAHLTERDWNKLMADLAGR